MFCDTAKVSLKAGKGGDGAVSFRHEIYINKGGPDGGNGGKGGSIIFVADKDTNTLIDFRFNPILTAENGGNGSGTRSAGRSGKDLLVEVPIGTIVKRDGVIIADLTRDGEKAVIAKGGDGGFGNAHFKSSVRQTPRMAEFGEPGESFEVELELKLLADVGLIGFPNAGKSTFIRSVSAAKPKVADYPFTTLVPSLGVARVGADRSFVVADIPGLIEGAAEGAGLGIRFLKHLERCRVLIHLVDIMPIDESDPAHNISVIESELYQYSEKLSEKPTWLVFNKIDTIGEEEAQARAKEIAEQIGWEGDYYLISAATGQNVQQLTRDIMDFIEANPREVEEENKEADEVKFKCGLGYWNTERVVVPIRETNQAEFTVESLMELVSVIFSIMHKLLDENEQ